MTAKTELPSQEVMARCARESGLADEYVADPALLQFYTRRLLKRGWAGERSATEKRYCSLVYHQVRGIVPDAQNGQGARGFRRVETPEPCSESQRPTKPRNGVLF